MFTEILTSTAFATLSFQSMSGTVEQVSNQKNLVLQAIRTAFPNPSAFIEETTAISLTHEETLEHYRLDLKCITCHPQPDNQLLVIESVKAASDIKRNSTVNLTFDTTYTKDNDSESVSTFNWKVSLEAKPLQFGLFAVLEIQKGEPVTPKKLKVEPCLAAFRCDAKGSYPTFQMAVDATQRIEQMVSNKTVAAGRQINITEFETRALISRGETVKLTNRISAGITIRTLATALRSGKPSEVIPVTILRKQDSGPQPQSRGETVNARVTGNGEVEYVE